jgi:phosphoribosylglycinamide formyltransferase-1
VIISGEGTNLQALIDAASANELSGRICAVISNRPAARGLARARAAGIAARSIAVAPTHSRDYDAALIEALDELNPDLIVLAGYMRILSEQCVAAFSDRILNLHPSLLPRHKGSDTHRRVLAAGDTAHGATVHFVTPELDGGPAVIQYRLNVTASDTEQSLSVRVHKGEYIILPTAVRWFCDQRLRLRKGIVMLDDKPLQHPIVIEERS